MINIKDRYFFDMSLSQISIQLFTKQYSDIFFVNLRELFYLKYNEKRNSKQINK